jgi:hypothetical protein
MSAPVDLNDAGVSEADDALRALVSSILSGVYKEQVYLRHVFELCRDEPDTAPQLLGLIDRYYRLGRMPAPQFQKLKAKIEQAMGTRPPDPEDDNDESEESDTRELRAVDAPAPRSSAAPQRAAASPRAATARRAAAQPRTGVPPRSAAPPRSATPPGGSAASTSSPADSGATVEPQATPAETGEPLPPTETPTIGIGTVLRNRYELVQLLGRGGMASVYKARDRYRTSLGVVDCWVAIKIVQPDPSRPAPFASQRHQRLRHRSRRRRVVLFDGAARRRAARPVE